jgi:hypothetical protein
LDHPDSLEFLRALAMQPRTMPDVAGIVELCHRETYRVLGELEDGGLVERWAPDAWKLTQLGAELWTQLRPVVDAL